MSSCGGRRNKWEYRLTKYQEYCKHICLGSWSYIEFSSDRSVRNIKEHLGIDMII